MARGTATGTYREVVLAHLAEHPNLTAYELEKATTAKGSLTGLLRAMERQALVVATPARHPGQRHPVTEWRVAPPGTVPGPAAPESPERIDRRRARQRAYQRRRQQDMAAAVVMPSLPDAACRGADPALFFPGLEGDETEALALCGGCPARAACGDLAEANGERYGIWGGVNLERTRSQRKRAS
jgi:WhiB family redox-sensing transcriptional regulator